MYTFLRSLISVVTLLAWCFALSSLTSHADTHSDSSQTPSYLKQFTKDHATFGFPVPENFSSDSAFELEDAPETQNLRKIAFLIFDAINHLQKYRSLFISVAPEQLIASTSPTDDSTIAIKNLERVTIAVLICAPPSTPFSLS